MKLFIFWYWVSNSEFDLIFYKAESHVFRGFRDGTMVGNGLRSQ